MLIFIFGKDTYRSSRKLNEIIERYKKIHKSGLNLKIFEGENLNFEDFKNFFNCSCMFQEKKLIVLKDIFSNLAFKKNFLEEKEHFVKSKHIILIYERKEIPKKDILFQFLIKHSKFQEFQLLEGEKLKKWVEREFSNYKTKIEQKALEKLVEFVGNDLWQMANEIKKLVTYKKRETITEKDVEILVGREVESDIFKTIDALAQRNKPLALKLIHQHLERGENPIYLLAMINFQFRNLLMVKSKDFQPAKLDLSPFLIKKLTQHARKFSLEELKKIYQKIFKIDLTIKTGKIDPGIALYLFIAEI